MPTPLTSICGLACSGEGAGWLGLHGQNAVGGGLSGALAAARRPILADYVVQTMPHGMPSGPAGLRLVLFNILGSQGV